MVVAVETVGEETLAKTPTKRPGAENYNTIYNETHDQKKHLPKTQDKTQHGEKRRKPKSVEEAPEKANPPGRLLTIPRLEAWPNTTIL